MCARVCERENDRQSERRTDRQTDLTNLSKGSIIESLTAVVQAHATSIERHHHNLPMSARTAIRTPAAPASPARYAFGTRHVTRCLQGFQVDKANVLVLQA